MSHANLEGPKPPVVSTPERVLKADIEMAAEPGPIVGSFPSKPRWTIERGQIRFEAPDKSEPTGAERAAQRRVIGDSEESSSRPAPKGDLHEGATTARYTVHARIAQRKSGAELDADVGALHAAWPKDAPPGVDPPLFLERAAALDAYKLGRFASFVPFVGRPGSLAVQQFIDELDVIHGKRGHRANLQGVVGAFLDDAVRQAKNPRELDGTPEPGPFESLLEGQSVLELDRRIREAALYLSLGDVAIPTGVLAAHRRLTDEETNRHIKPRTEVAASLFREIRLGDERVATLMADVRPSDSRARGIDAQLLQLLDDAAAMGSKPFFRSEGKIDAVKLVDALSKNAALTGIRLEVLALVTDAVRRGVIDAGLSSARDRDLYVR